MGFEKGLDQERLEARALAHFGMAFEIGAGGNAPHYMLDGQHCTAPYKEGHVVDLLDKMCCNLFFVHQAKDIGFRDGAPSRLSNYITPDESDTSSTYISPDPYDLAYIS